MRWPPRRNLRWPRTSSGGWRGPSLMLALTQVGGAGGGAHQAVVCSWRWDSNHMLCKPRVLNPVRLPVSPRLRDRRRGTGVARS